MGNRCSFSSNNQDGGIMADVVDPSGSSVGNVSSTENANGSSNTTSQRESKQNNTKNTEAKDTKEKSYCDDSIVNSVIGEFIARSNLGKLKYGVTLDREDLTIKEWIQHMQEELMDAILYLEKIKRTTNSMCPNLNRGESPVISAPISPIHPHPFFTKMPPELFTPRPPSPSPSPLIVYEDQDSMVQPMAQPKLTNSKVEFEQFI